MVRYNNKEISGSKRAPLTTIDNRALIMCNLLNQSDDYITANRQYIEATKEISKNNNGNAINALNGLRREYLDYDPFKRNLGAEREFGYVRDNLDDSYFTTKREYR